MKTLMKIDKWWSLFICFLTFGVAGCGGERPTNLGVENGQLADCPDTPNCVSTQTTSSGHRMEPVAYNGSTTEAQMQILAILADMERVTIVENNPGYIHAEARSRRFRFVDDVEFYFDSEAHLIHFRAAARLGRSDLGVNRKRMTQIVSAFRQSLPVRERRL